MAAAPRDEGDDVTVGRGKYDDAAKLLLQQLQAEGVLIIVINGVKGSGASATGTIDSRLSMAAFVEQLAPRLREEASVLEAVVRRRKGRPS